MHVIPSQLPGRAGRIGLGAILVAAITAAEVPDPGPADYKKLSLEQLMDIEVTSVSRRPEPQAGAASAIQVVTNEDIRRSGASTIPEALRLASNLHVAQADARDWAVSARGFNGTLANKMLVMIDGRTVYTPLFAGVFWDAQQTVLADVDRIEVISGPGATLWGANAVNGVINIVTRPAKETQGVLLEGGGGSEARGFGTVRYGDRLAKDLHYRVYGMYASRDDTVTTAGDDAGDKWDLGQGGFRADWDATATTVLTLQGDLYDSPIDQPDRAEDLAIKGGNVLGRWSQGLTEASDLTLQVYYDQTVRRIPDSIRQQLQTVDVDLQHHLRLAERNDLVWGFGYRLAHDDIENPPALAILPDDVSREWFTGFIQDELTLVPRRLSVIVGTKLEHNEYTGLEYQPSGRVVLHPAPDHTIWAAVSRAVRTPSRLELDLYVPRDPPYILLGNRDFTSERLWAYELGYRVQPTDRLSTAITLFYHDYDRLRSVEQAAPPAPTPVFFANRLAGESYGAEVTADAEVADWWRIHGGWTGMRVVTRARPGSTQADDGENESLDPTHQVALRSAFDLPHALEVDVIGRYVTRIANSGVPAYGEIDLRLGWMPRPGLALSLVGQNLVHDDHAEFGEGADRREIERSVYGKASWRF